MKQVVLNFHTVEQADAFAAAITDRGDAKEVQQSVSELMGFCSVSSVQTNELPDSLIVYLQ